MKFRSYNIKFDKKILLKNLVFSLIIVFSILLIGLTITFILTKALPGDPILAYCGGICTQDQYENWLRVLGLDKPMIEQYFIYLRQFFTGNWGVSSAYRGLPVSDVVAGRFSKNFDLIAFSMIPILLIGIPLGLLSIKFRKKWPDKIIQSFTIVGISFPVFFLGMLFQYLFAWKLDILPAIGYKTSGIGNPPFVTGFRLIDSFLSGNNIMARDYFIHLILPIFCLTSVSLPLIIRQIRSRTEKLSYEESLISNTIKTAFTFGLIFTLSLLVESVFNLHGIVGLFIVAFNNFDHFLISGLMSVILLFLFIIILISNVIFSVYKSSSFTRQDSFEKNSTSRQNDEARERDKNPNNRKIEEEGENPFNSNSISKREKDAEFNLKSEVKKVAKYIYSSPFILVGLIIVISVLIFALFPELISGYSLEEATGVYSNVFEPPSSEHPLGTGEFGRDMLALVLWGTQDALIFGLGAVLIGIFGGLAFGLISSVHKYANRIIEILMILTVIIPGFIMILFITMIFRPNYLILMQIIGIVLTPFFTRIIAYVPLNRRNITISLKKLLIYIPLGLSFAILLYESLGFLALTPISGYVDLGTTINDGRLQFYISPWAAFWPGFFLLLIGLGFITLHYGLRNTFLDRLNSSRIS